jgi:hypothetical protein
MLAPARYTKSADENALFTKGVVSWKLDIASTQTLESILQRATWKPSPFEHKSPFEVALPVGHLTKEDIQHAKDTVTLTLNDPVLFPGLRQLGKLIPKAVELQNGAFDDAWHHDHLSNKRGHAGQFFFIAYFGNPTWERAWGGGFHYGARSLDTDWPQIITPPTQFESLWPVHRTALLGWNENPLLVHRAEFLTGPHNRIAFLMPIDIIPHHQKSQSNAHTHS